MTLGQILSPVAAATAVNLVLAALAWRATQVERRTGKDPWYLGVLILGYCLPLAFFGYSYRGQQIATKLELFGAALGAEALGALVIFGFMHSIYRKDRQPRAQRAFEIGGTAFLLIVIFAGVLWA